MAPRKFAGPEGFLRSLDWSLDIDWFEKSGVYQIDKNRVAKISLYGGDGLPVSGEYRGLLVAIVHKQNGPIDRQAFHFDEYLGFVASGPRKTTDGYKIICSTGWGWYIADGGKATPVCEAVEHYIQEWE